MFLESLGMATLLWATLWATYGESYWAGGVIKNEEYKDLGLWRTTSLKTRP